MSSPSHIKRYAAPSSWVIERKVCKHIVKCFPGSHPLENGMALGQVLRMIGVAHTMREIRNVTYKSQVLVDGKRVKDPHTMVGLMDVLSVPSINVHKRVVLNTLKHLIAIDTKHHDKKVVQVRGVRLLKNGKVQVNCSSARNVLVEKNTYKRGDSLVIALPKQTIAEHLALKEGAQVYLTGGRHAGSLGVIEEVKEETVWFRIQNQSYETKKSYAFVVPEFLVEELQSL